MKTFEERYTAWIDGELEGPILTSFELELSRRASAGEARTDKEDATRLHRLLTTHLQAPAMTNAEFFSHQLRERIAAERSVERRREDARQAKGSLFAWPFLRLAGLGAACVFVATALYYGMMPSHTATPTPQVAANVVPVHPDVHDVYPTPGIESLAESHPASRPTDGTLAMGAPTPPPVDLNADIEVVKVPESPMNTTATPLQYKDPNVNVLWINGLDYMPTMPGESPAASVVPAPTGGRTP